MSIELSRRQSLKAIAGAGLLSVIPLSAVYAGSEQQIFTIATTGLAGDAFNRAVNRLSQIRQISATQIENKNYENLVMLSDLPNGSLLIGLANEAEKVLLDAIVQNRRGIINTTARMRIDDSAATIIPSLAEMTVQAALDRRDHTIVFNNARSGNTTRTLTSFYAYM